MKKKYNGLIDNLEERLNVVFTDKQRKVFRKQLKKWTKRTFLVPTLPIGEFTIPDCPEQAQAAARVTAVKQRSSHPDPRKHVFTLLDRLREHNQPIDSKAVIDNAIAAGVTEHTARSLVHIWRKQRGLLTRASRSK